MLSEASDRLCKLAVIYGPRTSAYMVRAGLSPLLSGLYMDAEPIAEQRGASCEIESSGIDGKGSSASRLIRVSSKAVLGESTFGQVMQGLDWGNMLAQFRAEHFLQLSASSAQQRVEVRDCVLI